LALSEAKGLNLSFFEPETTFKCLNEIFTLLSLPALDRFFRDQTTGHLKKEFLFVVDIMGLLNLHQAL
jgi:hypothetical protein